jgi:hypothetical protein
LRSLTSLQDLYAEYFSLPPDPSPRSPLGFTWLLFSTARAALLPPHADLVTSFALLLACTHLLLRHVTPQTLHRDRTPPAESAKQQGAADALLLEVAGSHSAAEHAATVRHLAGMLQQLLAQLLQPGVAPVLLASGQQQDGSSTATAAEEPAWLSFPGLFAPDGLALPAAVQALQKRHQQLTLDADIDAMPFLTPPQAVTEAAAADAAAPAAALRTATAEQAGTALAGSAAMQGGAVSQKDALLDAEQQEVAAAAVEVVQAAAGGAAADEDPGSPEGRAMSEPVAVTPKRARVAPSHAFDQREGMPEAGGGANGEAPGLPDAAYRTPSPPRMRPLQPCPQPTPISSGAVTLCFMHLSAHACPAPARVILTVWTPTPACAPPPPPPRF